MRKSTKTAVGAISLGILGLSYQLGTSATASTGGFASPSSSAVPLAQASASATPDPVASVPVAPGSQSSESVNTAPQPAASSAAPAPSASASVPSQTTTSASVAKTGNAIESGFGPVQVKVTKVDGKITDIKYLQSVATHGRDAAFPYLVQYAIQANGTNFANLSGATYTTNAFKQSLESALAKF
ncbi:MAG: hypothetical protein RLZZ471_581 [Actinomycetota bacterium]